MFRQPFAVAEQYRLVINILIAMVPVSIVIIAKDQECILTSCLQGASQVTDDVVIVASSQTGSLLNSSDFHCINFVQHSWDGYGANKNKGILAARYDWILSIDADETPDAELIEYLHRLDFTNEKVVYDIKFCSYIGQKPIRFGSWGRDHHIRLFNRKWVKWSQTLVHEVLLIPEGIKVKKVKGHLHHYSVSDIEQYNSKSAHYARLSAKKYFEKGKRANFVKLYLSPAFGFIKNYFAYCGFLDGAEGWQIAAACYKNTRLKYLLLSRLEQAYHEILPGEDSLFLKYELI
jgi:glycosyltransferase involved in cell wall biosynthesis